MINFLKKAGWSLDDIKKELLQWNKKNYDSLRDGYILSQINWHKRQKENILPPNCKNESYYKGMAVCEKDNLCLKIKNPVNYSRRKVFFNKNNKKTKSSVKK